MGLVAKGDVSMVSRGVVAVVLFLTMLSGGCSCQSGAGPSAQPAMPAGWARVDTGKFSFYAPQDLKQVPVQGIDSFVREYETESFTLSFDYGRYSDPLTNTDFPNVQVSEEKIGGRKARIVSNDAPGQGLRFDHVIGVHFPRVAGDKISLTAFASCKTPRDRDTVRTIYGTIRLP